MTQDGTSLRRLALVLRRARGMGLRSGAELLRRRLGRLSFGSFDSTAPFADAWGYDRGTPVDRWYIERFLARHCHDITGRVLEVKDSGYTDWFGHALTERAVLDIDSGNERATHIADLARADSLANNSFDCFILTQTLQYIFDVRAALTHACRILRPGGVLLATMPVASRITDPPQTDYWRFTPLGVGSLLEEVFGANAATATGHGNVLAQLAFLEGLAAEDVGGTDLEVDDERFPLVVCARAVRPGAPPAQGA